MKTLISLGWEVKRRKVHHHPGTTKISHGAGNNNFQSNTRNHKNMTWCGNLVVTTFNLTWCDKIKCVVIGLLYGCGAFQKLEISKFLE